MACPCSFATGHLAGRIALTARAAQPTFSPAARQDIHGPAGGLFSDGTMEKGPRIPPEVMRFATLGVEFIAVFGLLLAAGIWADRRWSTEPAFMLTGAVIGFAGGIYRMVHFARQYSPPDDSAPSDEP